jgi:hypothetical protein
MEATMERDYCVRLYLAQKNKRTPDVAAKSTTIKHKDSLTRELGQSMVLGVGAVFLLWPFIDGAWRIFMWLGQFAVDH